MAEMEVVFSFDELNRLNAISHHSLITTNQPNQAMG